MRYAIVENDVIVNTVEADAEFAAAQGWVLVEGVNPEPSAGWSMVNGTWRAGADDDTAPPSIEEIAARLDALTAATIAKTDVTEQDIADAQAAVDTGP